MNNPQRLGIICLGLAWFLVFLSGAVQAQSSVVPENGDLSNGRIGWAFSAANDASCGVASNVGHTALGALSLKPACQAYSMTFSSSTSSVLTFWAYRSGSYTNNARMRVRSFSDQTEVSQVWSIADGVWTQYTLNVGSCSLCYLSIEPIDGGGYYYFDDLSLSAAIRAPAESAQATNGNFTGLFGWGGNYGSNQWTGAYGNTALGSFHFWDNQARIYGRPFVTDQSTWTFYGRCSYSWCTNGWLKVGYFNYDSGYGLTELAATGSILNTTTWQSFTANFSGVPAGNRISLWVQGYVSMLDDLCPGAGCTVGTPTPTATSTSTPTSTVTPIPTWVGGGNFPYGPGTPIPIDWSRFPTPPPYPTFPQFLTQVPYPTPIYGPGTAIPITGSVSITGVVKIDDRTPVRVKVDDSTPVAVKVDDRTPVHVSFVDNKYTPVPWQNSGGSTGPPAAGAVLPTLITSPSQSAIQYGQGGSSSNPLNFHIEQVDYAWNGIGVDPLGLTFNLKIHYYYPDAFSLAGIDLLPGIYGLGAAYVLVTIIRQLQAR